MAIKPQMRTRMEVDETSPAYIVIQKFDGLAELTRLSGWPKQTIHKWLKTGDVPHTRCADLLALSAKHGKGVTAADFVRMPRG